jgi:hypothetical protein
MEESKVYALRKLERDRQDGLSYGSHVSHGHSSRVVKPRPETVERWRERIHKFDELAKPGGSEFYQSLHRQLKET